VSQREREVEPWRSLLLVVVATLARSAGLEHCRRSGNSCRHHHGKNHTHTAAHAAACTWTELEEEEGGLGEERAVAGQAGSTCLGGWGGGAFCLCAELTSQYWLGRGREGGTVGEEMEQCKNKGWVATGRLAGQGHLKSKSSPNQTAAFQGHVWLWREIVLMREKQRFDY